MDRAAYEHCVVCALTLAWKMHQVGGAAAARAALPACRAEIPLTVAGVLVLVVMQGDSAVSSRELAKLCSTPPSLKVGRARNQPSCHGPDRQADRQTAALLTSSSSC